MLDIIPIPIDAIPTGIAALIAIILPPIINFINDKVKEKKYRYTIALATSGFTGLLVAMITNQFVVISGEAFFASIGITATIAQAVYVYYWKDKIEQKKVKESSEEENSEET